MIIASDEIQARLSEPSFFADVLDGAGRLELPLLPCREKLRFERFEQHHEQLVEPFAPLALLVRSAEQLWLQQLALARGDEFYR